MKPVVISKELAAFMKVPADSLHSRVSVTNAICSYIKDHNLQNPANKREITADAELTKILNYKSGSQPLTYFYIQQLIQPHFLKEVSVDLAAFMKVSPSSLQSSSTVSAALHHYVTSKNLLKDQTVTPDAELTKLLGKSQPLTVQAMNQLAKAHFKK
jgi:chromatin remodeling complex protein RSC6